MFEGHRLQEASSADTSGWEERFAALSEPVRRQLEQSWGVMETLINEFEQVSVPEHAQRITRWEHESEESTRLKSDELYQFYGKFFEPEENMDPMQHVITIKEGIADTWVARGEDGDIVSALQTILLEVPVKKDAVREAVFDIWYVATDPAYRGKPMTRELFIQAMRHSLEQAREKLMKMTGIVGETEPEVEKLFNRYGLKRLYYEDAEGQLIEVPFETPPEDESDAGVPEHLMVRLFDGRAEMTTQEVLRFADALYAPYSHPAFFTPDYLRYASEFYGDTPQMLEGIPSDQVSAEHAARYRHEYMDKIARIREVLEQDIDGAQGERVFFISERERRTQREQGKTIIDWQEEG